MGNNPIDRHFHNPKPSVKTFARIYTNFCNGSTENDLEFVGDGANDANAGSHLSGRYWHIAKYYTPVLIAATFLNGLRSNMKTMPMLNI